jgi:hypothetical protein
MIILMIVMKMKRRKNNKRIIRLKKAAGVGEERSKTRRPRWIIDLPGLAVVANDAPEGKTAIKGLTAVAPRIQLHWLLLH